MTRFIDRSSILRRIAASTALPGALLLPHLAQGQTVPTGGTPVSGGITIGTPTGNADGGQDLSIAQTEARGIINWQSFNVGQFDRVTFNQPSASAATLNRVTGGTSSTIAGRITAGGSVYLVNPNGIAITATGNVQTGGGFIASTLDITDATFNAGTNSFAGNGASARVSNAGSITASGFVALLGGTVSNTGTISVPAGRIALGSGEAITLDINGANFLSVATPTAATTADGVALIDNAGTITGGRIELTAATAADAVRRVVNVSGTINADTANGNAGSIVLSAVGPAGSLGGGTVSASGTLTAQATGTGNAGGNGGDFGNGGTITLSGGTLSLAGLTASTRSWSRDTGTLTLRQAGTFTAAASGNDRLSNLLGNNNVTITTTSGDIVVSESPFWMVDTALTLDSAGNISLNGLLNFSFNPPFAGPVGTLNLSARGSGAAGGGTITSTEEILIGLFNLTNGNWVQNTAELPAFSATDFRFTQGTATFLRAAGGDGSVATPYGIVDVYGLQGMASSNQITRNFVLVNDIDASGTVNWNAGAGFVGIGSDPAPFTGTLSGANGNGGRYSISGLTQNRPAIGGLFANLSGTVSNLRLTGLSIDTQGAPGGALAGTLSGTVGNVDVAGTITGGGGLGGLVGTNISGTITDVRSGMIVNGVGDGVGGLVGYMNGGRITRGIVTSTGSVQGAGSVGGLVGLMVTGGSVVDSSAAAAVTAAGLSAGGLIGDMQAGTSVSNSRATGNVTNSGLNTGGLVGRLRSNLGGVTTSIANSFATGIVTGVSNVGGLVGYQNATSGGRATITGSYATGAVSATSDKVGGLVGYTFVQNATVGTLASIAYSYASGSVSSTTSSPASYVGGLVGNASKNASANVTLTIDNSYATGAVRSNGNIVGGLIGYLLYGTVSNVYATGSVTGPNVVGGLFGDASRSVISSAYASGAVISRGPFVGGLVGGLNESTLSKVYWDSYSTGRGIGGGGGETVGIAVSSDPNVRSAYTEASYANLLKGASSVGTATPTGFVFLPGNSTRPFLAFEVPTAARAGTPGDASAVRTIRNSHELQLIGYNAETLSGNYRLANSIDLSETGRVVAGTPGSYSGMWAPTGFVSLGTDGAGLTWDGTGYKTVGQITSGTYGYGGTFDGGGFTLSNLLINRVGVGNTGLFGTVSGTLRNVTVGGTVTGGAITGGLVGLLIGGPTVGAAGPNDKSPVVANATSTVNVTGTANTGGLVGSATRRSSVSGTASGTVTGTNVVGGLVGNANRADITGMASGAVNGQTSVGGLIGQQFAGNSVGYATGSVTGTTWVGGMIGKLDGTATERGTATATRPAQAGVNGPPSADRNFGQVTANGTASTDQLVP